MSNPHRARSTAAPWTPLPTPTPIRLDIGCMCPRPRQHLPCTCRAPDRFFPNFFPSSDIFGFAEQLASAPTPMDPTSPEPPPHPTPTSTPTSSTTPSTSGPVPAPTASPISSDPSTPPAFRGRWRRPQGYPLVRLRLIATLDHWNLQDCLHLRLLFLHCPPPQRATLRDVILRRRSHAAW